MQLSFRGHDLVLDPSGALFWPRHRLLAVADLHLEKGAAFARRGSLLPPYDTHATLARLEGLVRSLAPETVVSLGDGFHDREGPDTLSPDLFDRLSALTRAVRWIWITGNHDPLLPLALGGAALSELVLDGLVFRHQPAAASGIAGHLHPKARVWSRGRLLCRPCFTADDDRLVLPAFGSFSGGLNVLDPAVSALYPRGFSAYLLGDARVFRFPHAVLAPEPGSSLRRH
ncbi:ligase-associated DNA damage response endonuclease PdeM [Benzoatithermus flavus]|uniref:Ligase-associated DNA damage response endonuclease PdeM n=1 Tax=Benzoatithermus flavus TaxID=3108223 RepID=A0ABU8XRN5_9PROT